MKAIMVSWRIWDYEEKCFYFEDFSTAVRKFANRRYLLMSPVGGMSGIWSGDLLADEYGCRYLATAEGIVSRDGSVLPESQSNQLGLHYVCSLLELDDKDFTILCLPNSWRIIRPTD